MLSRIPTVLWIAGATLALGALTPVVGTSVTTAAPQPSAPAQTAPEPDSGGEGASASPAAPSGSAEAPDDAGAGQADAAYLVRAGASDLGPVAVDGAGFTLYMSVLDGNDPPVSVCVSAECVQAWEPLYLPDGDTAPIAGDGVDASLLGSLHRPDGTWQVTLNGWPLYRYSQDGRPGDVSGQGLRDVWYAVTPDGRWYGAAG